MDRRTFLQSAAAAALTATADQPAKAFATTTQKMIGVQVGAVSFADEGTERVLDESISRCGTAYLFNQFF